MPKRAQTRRSRSDGRLSAVLSQPGSARWNLDSLFLPQTFSSLRNPWERHGVHILLFSAVLLKAFSIKGLNFSRSVLDVNLIK